MDRLKGEPSISDMIRDAVSRMGQPIRRAALRALDPPIPVRIIRRPPPNVGTLPERIAAAQRAADAALDLARRNTLAARASIANAAAAAAGAHGGPVPLRLCDVANASSGAVLTECHRPGASPESVALAVLRAALAAALAPPAPPRSGLSTGGGNPAMNWHWTTEA